MLDNSALSAPIAAAPRHQRMHGHAAVGLSRRRGAVRLDALSQSGAAKAMLPRVHGPVPEVVFLNTAGGLTEGDRLSYALACGAGAQVLATTQTAERGYASAGGHAEVDVAITLGAGATLHWLPQETILYQEAAIARLTRIEMPRDATLLMSEMLVLGRAAMGERLTRLDLTETRQVRRGGRLALHDALRLTDETLANRSHPAHLGDATALATLHLIAPRAEDALEPLRRLLEGCGLRAAASAWDGRLTLRALAADPVPLRRLLARVIPHLTGRPLPRVWQT